MDVSTVRWWVVHFSSGNSNSGSPLLVQILRSAAYRLLFIAGESAWPMLKNSALYLTICSINSVTVLFVSVVVSMEIIGSFTFGVTYMFS